ncbi:hypothetical protein NHP20013_05460 [Helicobacter bizzozeronii]|nr:hypothetical protein NHP20013_05460 [Helicobacter bizzozeronii]
MIQNHPTKETGTKDSPNLEQDPQNGTLQELASFHEELSSQIETFHDIATQNSHCYECGMARSVLLSGKCMHCEKFIK